MSKIKETFGTLLFIRKNGEPGTSYHLSAGKTIIGTSTEATIRIKRNELLEGIHCIVDVTDDGIATVVNKSTATPISVNTVTIRKFKVLSNKDTIDIAGKQFIYINDNLSIQKVEKYRTALKNIISTPTKRQSVAPILKVGSAKKTPNVRSITPIQKKPLSRMSFRTPSTGPMTPNRKPDRKDLEKCQTMSKLIGHKSVLPKGFKKRRLSLDSHVKPSKGKQVSERNILLSENIEEDPVPTLSLQKDGDKAADFTVLSNTSSSSEEGEDSKRRSMKAPSRASVTEVAPIKGTPKNTPLVKAKTPFTPIEDEIRKSVLEKGSLTGNKDKTPVFTRKSKNLRGETPKTPIPRTPINKRLELLKGTPSSSRRSKSLESVAKSNENLVEIESPRLSNSKKNDDASVRECITPTTGTQIFRSEISEKKKRRRNSVDHTTLPEKSFQKRRKTEGGRPNEDVFFRFTPKKTPATLSDSPISRRSRISTIDSGNLSDGSVNLNISTGSSISPIPRDVLSSVDSDIPDKQSVETRRSSRKSQRAKEEDNGDSSTRSKVNDSNLKSNQSLRENLQNNEDENQDSSSESSENSCQEMSRNNLDNSKLRKSLIDQFPNSLKNNEEYKGSSKGLEKSPQNTSENKMNESKLRKSQRMQRSVRESVKNNEDQDTSSSTESSEKSPRQETSRKSLSDSKLRKSLDNSQQMERSVRNKNDDSFESLEKSPQREASRVSLQDSKLRKSLRNSQKLNKSLQNSLETKDDEDQDSSFDSSEKSVEELSKSNLNNSTCLKKGEEKSLSRSRHSNRNSSPDKMEKRSSSEDSEVANLFRRRGLGNKETVYHSSPIASLNIQDTPKDVESNDEEKEESSIDVSILSSMSEDEKEADKSKEHLRRSNRVNRKDVSSTSDDSDIKPIFVPQRRPPIKRSYGNDKELSVHLSNTPGRQSEGFNKENDLSTVSNRSARSSSRRSISKRCKSCDVSSDSRLSTKETFTKNLNDSVSSESDSVLLDNSFGRVTPRKSLLANKSQSEGEISDVESLTSLRSSKSYKSPPKNLSVISVKDDSVKSTPENNTSIIILDTPLELTGKNSRKKLSKTLNSSIEDCELTTPKSAIRSRRSMSLPYKPIVEEITPVTPEEGVRKGETSFKTPMNTPGLFENIKNSVLKSRSRKTGNLMEELNRAEVKAEKRPRESTGSVGRSTKKRKVMDEDLAYDSVNEDLDASFASFATDEVFADIADQYVAPTTPTGFTNLTDKPVITDPQQRSLSEPRAKKCAPKRRSLHAMKFESKSSDSDKEMNSSISTTDTSVNTSCSSTDLFDDSSVGSRRSSRRLSVKEDARNKRQMTPPKSPKNDLSDVCGIKRLLSTPKTITSPKNDLTNIIGVKKLLSTPKVGKSPKNDLTKVPNLRTLVYPVRNNSPKNDLSDVAGVKKLLGTPKVVKSPKNDLRNVPNLRKIMSPRRQNSPTNDLRNIIGVKKLLATPKKQNSPKNDLTKVPNLRRVMSPKQQNEPKNDLTEVVGVKKLFSTPKKQNPPGNDLTKVPNLRKMMYPRQQNSPRNDLSDVDGVADLFAEQENDSDLFDKLFVKKPIRTYRGRSMSPITRKAMLYGQNDRKTLGDKPYSSPRIEKWLEEQVSRTNQAVVKLERMNDEDLKAQTVQEEASPKSKRAKRNDMDAGVSQVEEKPRNRRGALQIDIVEVTESPRSMRLRQKRIVQENSVTGTTPELKPPQAKRGRPRKNSQKDDTSPDEEIQNLEELKHVPSRRGRPRKQSKKDDEESSETDQDKKNILEQVKSAPIRRGRANIPSKKYEEEEVVVQPRGRPRSLSCDEALLITKPSLRGRRAVKKDVDEVHEEVAPPPRRRGKKIEEEKVVEEDVTPQVKKRGKGKAVVNEESDDSKEQKSNNRGRKTPNIEEDKVNNDEEIPQTRRRGRAKAASSEESVDSVEQKGNRRGRRAPKIEVGEVEVTPQQNTKTSPDYESVDDADGKVNSRGRKLAKDDEDTKIEEMPKKRGRKNVTEAEETPNENKEVKETVTRRGRRKAEEETPKAEDKDNIDIEENKEKPVKKRGGRRKVEVEEKEEPLKEASNINKELTVTLTPEKIEVVKRGGRRKIVAESSDEISKEENKENEQGKSRNKKQPAKGKNVDLDGEISDSPRSTRLKKGNFKKYGSDFLIEEGGGKMKKTVRFEDTEDSNGKNKRKGKVAEQTEEVENEVRRSKRTRK